VLAFPRAPLNAEAPSASRARRASVSDYTYPSRHQYLMRRTDRWSDRRTDGRRWRSSCERGLCVVDGGADADAPMLYYGTPMPPRHISDTLLTSALVTARSLLPIATGVFRNNLPSGGLVVSCDFYARKQLLLSARLSHRNSVCLTVCLSVTRVDQSKTVQARITKSSSSAAWNTLVSGTVKLYHTFEGSHPERGR